MTYKKVIIFTIFLTIISIAFLNFHVYKAFASPLNNKTLIIYDKSSVPKNFLNNIEFIVKAYDSNVTTINFSNYKNNLINQYSNVIIIGSRTSTLNDTLLNNITNSTNKICWIGAGFESLIKYYDKSLKPELKETIVTEVNSNNKSYAISKEGYFLKFNNTKKLNIQSSFSDGVNKYPYIMNYKNLMYISSIPDSKILMYIFSQNISKFFYMETASNHKISITLNLNNINEAHNLFNYAEILNNKKISFWVIVSGNLIKKNNLMLMSVLKKVQNFGGSIIINSTENSVSYYKNLSEILLNNGIYPLGVSLDSSSIIAGNEITNNFTTLLCNNNANNQFDISNLPYLIKDNEHSIIPNNLSGLGFNNADYIQKLKYYSNILPEGSFSNLIIPTNITSDFFTRIIQYIKEENNFNILNVKNYSSKVNLDGLTIENSDGSIVTNYKRVNSHKKSKSLISKINDRLISIIFIFCFIFLLIFIYYRYLNKRKFLR